MYSSIYKHFQSAATLTARLFPFLQVYFFFFQTTPFVILVSE